MARLHLTVEGPTEQAFAANVLRPHLQNRGVYVQRVELVAHVKRRRQVHRGGLLRYEPFRNDILRRLKGDKSNDVFLSTMIDLYKLPQDVPKFAEYREEQNPQRRVEFLETALGNAIGDPRFIPHIQLYEFEAILFADVSKFSFYYTDRLREINKLAELAAAHDSPETINDGEDTAPSKRIIKHIPDYKSDKSAAGPIIAEAIGLNRIREKCPHFNKWLDNLEGLGNVST